MAGEHDPLGNALGGEQVDVLELVFAFLEVAHLDKTLINQGLEAIVEPADAHPELVGQLALGEVWVVLQDAHDPEMRVFLDLGLAGGHVEVQREGARGNKSALATLPPCQSEVGKAVMV